MKALKTLRFDGPFQMKRGVLNNPTFAFETWGTLNADRSNCVLIFTGLSPSAHAASSNVDPSAGWWEDMLGPVSYTHLTLPTICSV